jgi:L-2-hydroxyglutarate oxidase
MVKKAYDFAILGGGIYGINIARGLLNKFKTVNILLLDKDKEMITDNPLLLLNNTEYLFNPLSKKYNYMKEGHIKLKDFCTGSKITYLERDNLTFAKSKREIELMAKKTKELEGIEIDFEKVKDMEPLIYEAAKNRDYYYMGTKGLVDYNMLKRSLYNSIEKEVEIKKSYVDKVEKEGDEYRIITRRTKAGGKEKFDEYNAKYIINASGTDSLRLAKQVSKKLNTFKQYNYIHSYYKLPNKRNIVNILSSPQGNLYPGLILYKDTDGYIVLGPVVTLSQETNGILSKLKQFKDYLSFLSALVQTFESYEYEVQFNHVYKAKTLFSTFLELYYVIGTEKLHTKHKHGVLVNNKRIVDDVIIHKEDNSIHLLNTDIDNNGVTMLFPITDEILNSIK